MGCGNHKPELKSLTIKRVEDIKASHSTFAAGSKEHFHKNFKLEAQISTGNSSKLYRAISHSTGQLRAVKIIEKEEYMTSEVDTKAYTVFLKSVIDLDHPSVLTVLDAFQTDKEIYLIMEYMNAVSLQTKLAKRHLSEKETALLMHQVLSAVTFCHSRSRVHGNISLDSVLIEEDNSIKLINFEHSFFTQKSPMDDIQDCGLLMYYLLTRKTYAGSLEDLNCSKHALNLIEMMIEQKIEPLKAVNHVWIQKYKSYNNPDFDYLREVLVKLSSFSGEFKLRNAVFTYMATHLVNSLNTKKLMKVFRVLDRNGDGILNRDELLEVYRELVKDRDPEKDVDSIMKHVDTDNNGYIEYTELIQAALNYDVICSRKNLESAFKVFDKDNSGTISAQEIRDILSSGHSSVDDVWNDLIADIDKNGDGEIDLKEFTTAIMSKI